MIARLRGPVLERTAESCVIEAGGVGYLVHASSRTLAALPSPPEEARLHVEMVVREDAFTLYGFIDAAEREWFRLLTAIQGVGAKLALGLLSSFPPERLAAAIEAGDRALLRQAPGVGEKLATRLIAELAGRLPAARPLPSLPARPRPAAGGVGEEALSALLHLGYRRAEAEPVLGRALAALGEGAALAEVIRVALRELGR